MLNYSLLRLIFEETRQRVWWLIPPILIVALCAMSPSIVPSDLRASWAGNAITQFAWGGAWLLGLPAMLIEASRLGAAHRQRFQHLFWRGVGLSAPAHILSMALPLLGLGSLSALTAALLSFCFGYHSMMHLWPWLVIHLQAIALFLTASFGLVCLSLGVAIEVSSAGAITLAAFILFAGEWLTVGLDEMRLRSEGDFRTALEIVSFFIPQYRFADLTERIVYQWGALTLSSFCILWGYFACWSLLMIATIWQNFQPHRRRFRKAVLPGLALAALGIIGLGLPLLFKPAPQLAQWRAKKERLGFNPIAVKDTGIGEVITDVLVRQVDVSWHGGGQPWSRFATTSLTDFLQRHYRELTTHPFAPTYAERFHNRERSQGLVRLAFYLSPSNIQAYQAYFHLLSIPSLTAEVVPPSGNTVDTAHENEAPTLPLNRPSEGDYEEMRSISYMALQNVDMTSPQQCLAAGWIWFNLFNITPSFEREERQKMAQQMLYSLSRADAAWNEGRPVPPGYDFKQERRFLGKLSLSVIKNAKE